ncbi:MAG TPA: hypothetical protein VFT13_02505 [Candidatus Krumholzibacteria bacterium]|nr:hypothetical protein [Candidatus Krumholzibacteria bacterium]
MNKVGIWIDHRKAVVIQIIDGVESRSVIKADVERHAGPSGGWRMKTPWGPQATVGEHQREERYQHQLARFYKDVVHRVGHPDQLLVMGPAAAKNEFVDLASKAPDLRGVPLAVEPADKMSERKIAEKVREYVFE